MGGVRRRRRPYATAASPGRRPHGSEGRSKDGVASAERMRGGRQHVKVVRGQARSGPRHKTRHTWRHRRKGKASDRKPLISRVAGLAYFVGIRCYARADRCAATKQELNGLCAAACSPWLRNGRNGTRPFTARASKRNDVARTVS